MKVLDRLGQRLRVRKALPYIRPGSTVLDIGTGDGALFRALGNRCARGVGIDPEATDTTASRYRLIRGWFPADLDDRGPFDVITALAVLEHVPRDQLLDFAHECRELVVPGGTIVLTVPQPAVDKIVELLAMTPFADGLACHEHYGLEPLEALPVFQRAGLWVADIQRFEFRLNNLFVFQRSR